MFYWLNFRCTTEQAFVPWWVCVWWFLLEVWLECVLQVLLTMINSIRTLQCVGECVCGFVEFIVGESSMQNTSQHSPLRDVNTTACLEELVSYRSIKYLDTLVVTVHGVQVGQVTRSAGTGRLLWRSHMFCWTQEE